MPYRLLVRAASRATGRLGYLRGAMGAGLGIAMAMLAARMLPANAGFPLLVAPVGASAVLVFGLPASPLAQPWAVFGGSMVSALTGTAVRLLIPDPLIGAPLAMGLAFAAMSLCRCLHPPGGACAMLGAIGGHALLAPLAINLAGLIGAGLLWNNATQHRYPHRAGAVRAGPPQYTSEDLDSVLEEWEEVLDVSREDLDALFREVEARVHARA